MRSAAPQGKEKLAAAVSASTAGDALLAEEEQAAARAAAKKAKKLKQKKRARQKQPAAELEPELAEPSVTLAEPESGTCSSGSQGEAATTSTQAVVEYPRTEPSSATFKCSGTNANPGQGQTLNPGQVAPDCSLSVTNDFEDDEGASFLGTLFCCPITKVCLQLNMA